MRICSSRSTTMASVGVCTRPTVVRKKPPSRELKAVIARVPLMPTSQSASERDRAASARPCICSLLRSAVEAVADRLRRHRLQPQPPDRLAQRLLAAAGVLLDQAEDQLALAARVAGVDEVGRRPCAWPGLTTALSRVLVWSTGFRSK